MLINTPRRFNGAWAWRSRIGLAELRLTEKAKGTVTDGRPIPPE